MMKKTLLISVCLLFPASVLAFSGLTDRNTLDLEIDARIKVNQQYKEENLATYEDSEFKEQWKELEEGSNKAMIELLDYVKKSEDLKLKKLMLKTEYYMEVIYHMDEKEFAESDEETAKAEKSIKAFQEKIKKLNSASK